MNIETVELANGHKITTASAPQVKSGVKTTEFWLQIALNVATVLSMVSGILPGEWGITVMAIANGLYAGVRTWAKRPGANDANLRNEILGAIGARVGGNDNGGLPHDPTAGDRAGPAGGPAG